MAFGYSWTDYGWAQQGTWTWALKFAWLPTKMDSGEYLWWREYYHGVRMVTGPGSPVFLHQYMTTQEFTWKALTES